MWIVSYLFGTSHTDNDLDKSLNLDTMEKRMDKRKRGMTSDLEVALTEDEDREKRIQTSKNQYCGILLSTIILISFIYLMLSRADILHIALLHGSADYHPTHMVEKMQGLTAMPIKSQPTAINFNAISTSHSKDANGEKFLHVKADLIPEEPQLHHKVVIPPPKIVDPAPIVNKIRASNQEDVNPFKEEEEASHPVDVVQRRDAEQHPVALSLPQLQADAEQQILAVRKLKSEEHLIMETDPRAKEQIAILQDKVRNFLRVKYGSGPYYLEMSLRFPDSMLQDGRQQTEKLLIELGPIEYIPYCVYYFLQLVESWKGGAFHRNAGHVLQAFVKSPREGLAFQEYSPQFPHKKFTMGYAGRPGGPEFYISTVDNTHNHGPASQGSKTEADGCFGKIIKGFEVVERMKHQPGAQKGSGFINGGDNFIRIPEVRLVPANEVHLD